MKTIIKYIFSLVLALAIFFSYKQSKNYIFESIFNIYKNSPNNVNEEKWALYFSKDCQLVLCNEQNPHLIDIKFGSALFNKSLKDYYPYVSDSLCDALKVQLIDIYINLLTYIITNKVYENSISKHLAYHAFNKSLLIQKDLRIVLPKTYIELKKDHNLKNDVRLVTPEDIRFTKKENIYALMLGDRVINIILELEIILDEFERCNINTRPQRNFLKTISKK